MMMRSFDESLPMALLRAREATMRRFRPMLAEHDLTEQQWRVLRALAARAADHDDEHDDERVGDDVATAGIEVSQLGETTFLLGPSLSRILTNLEARSLITRGISPTDRRRASIAITDAGLDLVTVIAPESEAEYAEIESMLGTRRLGQLLDLLQRLEATAPSAARDRLRPPLRSA